MVSCKVTDKKSKYAQHCTRQRSNHSSFLQNQRKTILLTIILSLWQSWNIGAVSRSLEASDGDSGIERVKLGSWVRDEGIMCQVWDGFGAYERVNFWIKCLNWWIGWRKGCDVKVNLRIWVETWGIVGGDGGVEDEVWSDVRVDAIIGVENYGYGRRKERSLKLGIY